MRTIACLLLTALLCPALKAQEIKTDSIAGKVASANAVSEKSLRHINNKYTALTNDVNKSSLDLLERMQKKEAALHQKIYKIDSTKAQQIFAGINSKYQQLEQKAKTQLTPLQTAGNPLKQYIPGIDSISTLMHFLNGNSAISPQKLSQIKSISLQVEQLQSRLQQANDIQNYLQQREQLLKQQLNAYNVTRALKGINQNVCNYQQQLQQLKSTINDKQKLEQAVFNKVRELPAFQKFMQKNSMLAKLFPMPAEPTVSSQSTVVGLQTREQIQNHITTKLQTDPSNKTSGTDPSQYMQQQLQNAQGELTSLQSKLTKALSGNSGGANMALPDYTPNNQHSKSVLKRLVLGFNLQTESSTALLPAIGDIGLSIGYKLSDKATIGTGASYKIGLPTQSGHNRITNQGVGLRSFIDIKAKSSLWITAGYEYNYMQAFANISALKNLQIWQKSALAGLTKKYKIGKREGNIQLLYDFLYSSQTPQGKPLLFRVGYTL